MSSYQWGRKGGHFALAFCLSFFSGANAVADDTEIYFGASTAGTIRPNILFIMDTSGSMSTTVSGTTKSRLQTMQEALTDILDSVDNVNVGLMRYSAPSNTDNNGGPVLYPVKYIDDPAVEPAISATVSAASDDASEAIASPFDVVLNETCLPLSTATASAAPGAGELINGVAVALPSAAKDNLKYYTINVPTGTTNLTVTTTGGTGDADLFLRFGSNPTTSTYDCRGVSGTSNETCSIDSPSVGIYYVMVQAWSAYSGVTLTGTHDGTVCYAPTSGQRQVGIRFAGVNVPKGATITRAYLEVASATTASDAASLTIKAHKVGDSTTFTNTVTNISARPATTAVVNWTPGTWTLGGTYQSPDLKNVVQEIVNQSTWCGGNAMSLLIAGTGNRLIQSFEVGKNPPRLVVEYDESSAAGGCVIKSFLRQLSDKNDDAFQSDNGAITRDSSLNFKQNYWLGTRFRSIDIPKNATIVSASLELTASNTETGTISGLIYAEQNDNAGNFPKKKGTNNISGRAGGTSAALSIPSWNRDTSYQSGNIGPQIQAIVNRAG